MRLTPPRASRRPPPFRGRWSKRHALAARPELRTSGLLFPPPERGREGWGSMLKLAPMDQVRGREHLRACPGLDPGVTGKNQCSMRWTDSVGILDLRGARL